MLRLDNKAALITGAAMGIGRGIAEAMLNAGARVMLIDINTTALDACVRELSERHHDRVSSMTVDVTKKAQVQQMISATCTKFGRLDILVNNAWKGAGLARIERQSDEQLRGAFDMAVMAAFWAMQAALPEFRRLGAGRVINLCSLNGVNAHMYSADYNAAKEALRSLTRTAAREWASDQICCNIICPGAASEAYQRFAAANPANAAAMQAANPMGRIGDPLHDIGPVAVFLASDDCRYVTGNTFFVDGGAHINGVHWSPQPGD
ncbi:SDR family NAD(P)-dependent oxidoreductase [Halopseudomonas phragmitis]|uniref:Oxidoreductase n=1 Tax=Halopseudomonas phragmitis TaxID=1931241 RepID=A0A1V0B973_9GAMM|nr:SDR family oxidoreductase [Halopseudomonas phragmitis]AQZ96496.1 oxidoreductase [Halopseudomonas phragmitis]